MRTFVILTCLFFLLFSCTTRKSSITEKSETTIQQSDDILRVYHQLIAAIKERDFEKLSDCYAEDAGFSYDENTGPRYFCFNNEKAVQGKEMILRHYEYLFKKKLLDRIEYEYYEIERNTEAPWIRFINVWQNSDDQLSEILVFTKINGFYYIKEHKVFVKR